MITAVPSRFQVVTEIAPSSDPWQASWYNWHETESEDFRHIPGRRRLGSSDEPMDEASGCANFRALLGAESLAEVWEGLLGRTASQDYVIESWTQLLNLN